MVQVTGTRTIYSGRVFSVIVDEIAYASGEAGIREVVIHQGGAVIVPLFDDSTTLLVRQYRHPFRKEILEFPAGKLEKGEDPNVCAERELREETGYNASRLVRLSSIYTTPGFCSEELHIFLALGLTESPGGQQLDHGETGLTIRHVPFDEALAMAREGTVRDGKTLSALLLTEQYLLTHGLK